MEKMTIKEAAEYWVHTYMAPIETSLVSELEPDEITLPSIGSSVYLYESIEGQSEGEIIEISLDKNGDMCYKIDLGYDKIVTLRSDDFYLDYYSIMPMWGTMWSFKDICDIDWIESKEGRQALSDCGFRVYRTDNDYYFGIDGCGYDFYESQWIPLYKARGLKWHDDIKEHTYQMERKGYEIRNKYWCDGDEPIEPILYGEGELRDTRRIELYSEMLKYIIKYAVDPYDALNTIGFTEEEITRLKNTGYLE